MYTRNLKSNLKYVQHSKCTKSGFVHPRLHSVLHPVTHLYKNIPILNTLPVSE